MYEAPGGENAGRGCRGLHRRSIAAALATPSAPSWTSRTDGSGTTPAAYVTKRWDEDGEFVAIMTTAGALAATDADWCDRSGCGWWRGRGAALTDPYCPAPPSAFTICAHRVNEALRSLTARCSLQERVNHARNPQEQRQHEVDYRLNGFPQTSTAPVATRSQSSAWPDLQALVAEVYHRRLTVGSGRFHRRPERRFAKVCLCYLNSNLGLGVLGALWWHESSARLHAGVRRRMVSAPRSRLIQPPPARRAPRRCPTTRADPAPSSPPVARRRDRPHGDDSDTGSPRPRSRRYRSRSADVALSWPMPTLTQPPRGAVLQRVADELATAR
jgi:hypothetical protein